MLWLFGVRERRARIVVIALAAVIAPVTISPGRYVTRIHSIVEQEDGSSEARKELLSRSLEVIAHHPLLGIGPGQFPIVSGNWQVAHNSYAELAAEGGILALILFLAMVYGAFRRLNSVRKTCTDAETRVFAHAVFACLAAFMVGAVFSSVEYHFYPYFLISYAIALQAIANAKPNQAGEPNSKPGRFGYDATYAAFGARNAQVGA
jgi:O-antigen ligase